MTTSGRSNANEIAAIAAAAAFGRPMVTNVHRGLIVEAIVSRALPPDWRWCAGDYNAWDFDRADGLKLEVKQSASRQSWHGEGALPSRISFDIGARTGRYGSDGLWISQQCRWADLYIFAHHPVIDGAADHRDPEQWHFYVVPERRLPAQKRLALSRVQTLTTLTRFDEIATAIGLVA